MPRWSPPESRTILQAIADDVRRAPHERAAARRELAGHIAQSTQPSLRRRGRNSGMPQSQEDLDSDVENWFQRDLRDSSLTSSDRRDIFLGFDLSTRGLLDAFSNRLLGLFSATDPQVLIDAYSKTKSAFVKAKVIETVRHIATYSPLDKTQAQQFIHQLDQEK
jgi:hypothetical protein